MTADNAAIDPTKLRRARLTARMSQRGLARQVGIPAPAIQHLEAGAPVPSLTLHSYLQLTRVLDLAFDELFTPRQTADPPDAEPDPRPHEATDEGAENGTASHRPQSQAQTLIALVYDNQPITGPTITGLLGYTSTELDGLLVHANAALEPLGLTITSARGGYRIDAQNPNGDAAAAAKLAANSFTTRQLKLLLTLRGSPDATRVAYNRNDPNDHYLFRANLIAVGADGKLAPSDTIRWPSDLLGVEQPRPWTRTRANEDRHADHHFDPQHAARSTKQNG